MPVSLATDEISSADFELDSHFFYGILEEGKLVFPAHWGHSCFLI
ncbi:putative amino group acetyl transferase [Vibrio parahaemolyticus AQ3810]|nr:putative amino group acetyl transferase [Vibrio parahaemolyticus AQ3810]